VINNANLFISAIIKQFLEDVRWGDLDFLVIDTPPGTSDEHITICELLLKHNPDGAIIVTTPQNVSISDVRKEIAFCQTIGLPIIGIVENMSGFICPCCGVRFTQKNPNYVYRNLIVYALQEKTNIFSSGGGELLAKELGLTFLGRIPIDPQIAKCCEEGQSFFAANRNSASLQVLKEFANRYVQNSSQ